MTKQRTLARSAVILAVFGLTAKVLSAFYRVPLTNFLGAEGMGMYQLVFSIFALVISLTTGGIPLAVSRIVAEKNAKNEGATGVLKSAVILVGSASVIIAGLLILTGKYIALLQGNGAVKFGYTLLAPSIIFVGILAMFRGWFQGNNDVMPTAVSQVIEQAFKLIFGLLFARFLLPRGVIYAVYGALLGVAVSEFAALIYVVIRYAVNGKKVAVITENDSIKDTSKEIIKISIIFAIAGFINPFSQFIDSLLIVNVLKYVGESTAYATSLYGLFSGTVMSVVNMPVVLTLGLSVALIPLISASRVNRNLENIIIKSATSIKLAYTVGLPAAILLFIFAVPVVGFLYPSLTLAQSKVSVMLLRITCFSVLFSSQREIYASLLMALDKTSAVIKNNLASVAVKTAVSVILLLYVGIYGAAIAVLTFSVLSTLLNVLTFNKLLGKNVKLVKNVSTIFVSSAIMGVTALTFYLTIPDGVVAMFAGGAVSALVYLFCLMLFKVFDGGELSGIPLSRLFDRLTLKIRFWENEK